MNILKTAVILTTLLLPTALLSAEKPAPQPADKPASPTEQISADSHEASVLESITGGNYLYLKVDVKGKEVWLATNPLYPGGKVSKGDTVQYTGGFEMAQFKSKALNRVFDKILFITKIKKLNAKSLTDFEHVPADNVHSSYITPDHEAQNVVTVASPAKDEIKKADNGRSIEEIFSNLTMLEDKEVVFRAKAMKVSEKIMKKNWITLEDGTGTAPDNKLVATTKESINIGDTLTVKGILKTNIDLGAGYNYKVIIEDAKFTKE